MADYQETYAELQTLLASLERDSVSIDELTGKLNRGFELIEALRGRLTSVEAKIEEIISARVGTAAEKTETDGSSKP